MWTELVQRRYEHKKLEEKIQNFLLAKITIDHCVICLFDDRIDTFRLLLTHIVIIYRHSKNKQGGL